VNGTRRPPANATGHLAALVGTGVEKIGVLGAGERP
jgi:hypothetical protein